MVTDGPKTLDPVQGSTHYDNICCSSLFEPLLEYEYPIRQAPKLRPLLLARMPQSSQDGLTWRFDLKPGVRFHDDPCFPDGVGRELVAEDVFYSWKRMADDANKPRGWWLFENTIVGFDEWKKAQSAKKTFDYRAPVAGMKLLGRYAFEVRLKAPVYRFMYILAMFQTAVVPQEAVAMYGSQFSRHPVGTGPFQLEEWTTGQRISFRRHPRYHGVYVPPEGAQAEEVAQFGLKPGASLPRADRLEITFFVQEQPMWLQFRSGKLDFTTVPAEFFPDAFIKRTRKLRAEYRSEGIQSHEAPLLDFIYRGFNMHDPVVGGYSTKKKKLRQAISLALDWDEQNDAFYNGLCVVYDGMIPPGLDGHPPGHQLPNSYRGPDLPRARRLLAEAGYPGGAGLPDIEFYVSTNASAQEQTEMLKRQLGQIGVRLKPRLVDFSTLMEVVNNKKAPMFSYAWGSDYPDAENNLALFYGPNQSPGNNRFNYRRAEYDRLYDRIRVMPPSPERSQLYAKMRDMVMEDAPFAGSMARTRFYLSMPRLKHFQPTEQFENWYKYLDLAPAGRPVRDVSQAR